MTEGSDIRNRETTFEFDGKPQLTVSVGHDSLGLVGSYVVFSDGHRLIEIGNSYESKAGGLQLSGFSVVRFRENGRPAGRLDARVDRCWMDVPLASHLFIPPRPSTDVREDVKSSLTRKVQAKTIMALHEVENAIQEAFIGDVRVRIDEEAFSGRHEVRLDRLVFEPGEVTLAKFLFEDLRRNRIDFYFDPQGVVLIPRSRAWTRAEPVQYAPGDYGLTTDELRDLLYTTGNQDDWSDVGGQATLLEVDEGRLNVFHTQPDHIQFMQRLAEIATNE